jgi:hypothetical protein
MELRELKYTPQHPAESASCHQGAVPCRRSPSEFKPDNMAAFEVRYPQAASAELGFRRDVPFICSLVLFYFLVENIQTQSREIEIFYFKFNTSMKQWK